MTFTILRFDLPLLIIEALPSARHRNIFIWAGRDSKIHNYKYIFHERHLRLEVPLFETTKEMYQVKRDTYGVDAFHIL